MAGRLFLVATPIGNLADITHRAIDTLKAVAFIACEDTRHSQKLLATYGIEKPCVSLPAFAEGQRASSVVERIAGGDDCALITDAGSPAISDPGEKLVELAVERGLEVIPIPGPAALIAALSASGLPTGRFHFLGFLPRTTSEAREMLNEVTGLRATLVLYEAGNRTVDTLALLHDVLGDRRAAVARELTKLHEELRRGRLSELRTVEPRGEVVIVVEGRTGDSRWTEAEVMKALEEGLARGDRLKALANDLAARGGWASKDVYRLGLQLKENP